MKYFFFEYYVKHRYDIRLNISYILMAISISFFNHLFNFVHPLYLQLEKNPTLIFVTPPLSDTNFQLWRHDMLVACETKNKEIFVLSTISCPPLNDVLHKASKRCNKIVISWLTCSMSLPIKQSVM